MSGASWVNVEDTENSYVRAAWAIAGELIRRHAPHARLIPGVDPPASADREPFPSSLLPQLLEPNRESLEVEGERKRWKREIEDGRGGHHVERQM